MYTLRETKEPGVLEISFDYMESIHILGPFWDILSEYSKEINSEPQAVEPLDNYKFIEDGYKIQFYWNSCFTIYVFYIGKSQFRKVYDRLYGICARLNRQLNEKRYFKKFGEYPNIKH